MAKLDYRRRDRRCGVVRTQGPSVNKNALKLKDACDIVLADEKLLPRKDAKGNLTTYCNVAVQVVCELLGEERFLGKTANEIYEICRQSADWVIIGSEQAAIAAYNGALIIAACLGKPHGHVAITYPSLKTVTSAKWGNRECPMVASIGKENRLVSANFSFDKEPTYFARRVDLV